MNTFDMNDFAQIEADAVIILGNDAHGAYRVIPYWECDKTAAQLRLAAALACLRFVEDCGGGDATAQIFDYRIPA